MRVGFSTNSMSCQPLRNFGKADNLPKNNTPAANNNPAFTSWHCIRAEYDKLKQIRFVKPLCSFTGTTIQRTRCKI